MNDSEIVKQYRKYEPFFGNWHIKRFIGEGGFAKVFEIVRNDFGTEYTSALKIITVSKTKTEIQAMKSEGMSDAEIKSSLYGIVEDTVKEIQLMYKLKGNGNIVGYEDHAVMEHEDGLGWDILIKMECLTSLDAYIQQQGGKIAKRDIIKIGIGICKALEACQKYNIIHRDIKSDNIFVSADGEFKLGDFGIARIIERKDMELSKKGTSAYMAPEVYKGQTYTSAVDIYSLGIVLYRLMNNNRAPFLPDYPNPVSLDDRDRALMKRMSGEKMPRPKQVEKCRLTEIAMKACAYRPEERYSSPVSMRQELEAILYDRNDMTTGDTVMIYDADRNYTTASYSQSGSFGVPRDAEATEVLRDETGKAAAGSSAIQPEEGGVKILCRKCGNAISRDLPFCPMCGAVQPEEGGVKILCKKCGNAISRDVPFCPICGASQRDDNAAKKLRLKKWMPIAAAALAAIIVAAVIVTVKLTSDESEDMYVENTTEADTSDTEESTAEETDTGETAASEASSEETSSAGTKSETENNDIKAWEENILIADSEKVIGEIDENSKVLGSDIARKDIVTVTFLDTLDDMPDNAWDVSQDKNEKVMAWTAGADGGYDLFIGAEGGVAANEDSKELFAHYTNLQHVNLNGCFHTETASDMSRMFDDCGNLSELDLSTFDTSNVKGMRSMFYGCEKLEKLDVSSFDTSNAESMHAMFYNCANLAEVDVSGFDTAKVTNMRSMFSKCGSIKELDVSGFDTSNVETMRTMFNECNSLKILNVSGFNTSNVGNMCGMFWDCSGLTELDVSGFNTSEVTDMSYMFYNCSGLTELDVSNFNTSKVTDMSYMFGKCENIAELNVSGFDTSNVESMSSMYSNCGITELDVSGFNTSKVTGMSFMFNGCKNLKVLDVSGFDTSNVENMTQMFCRCKSLTELDISGFDTSSLTEAKNMFYGCKSLPDPDVSNFATDIAETMGIGKYD